MQARMDAQLLREAEKYARQPFRVDVTLDDSDSGKPIYVARIPELPGCHTHAGTMSEAVSLLNEVKVEFIYFMLEDGLPVPEPLGPDVRIETSDCTASAQTNSRQVASAMPEPVS